MNRILTVISIVLAVAAARLAAEPYVISPDSIHAHLAVLASDSLEGRETGEPGEWKAATYIAREFTNDGLEPRGDSGSFFQAFDFIKRISYGPKCKLSLNGKELKIGDEYSPLPQSANAAFSFKQIVPVGYGITTDDSSYDDYKGKDVAGRAVLVKRFAPPDTTKKIDLERYGSFSDKITAAVNHKVAAIFFITPDDRDDSLQSFGFTRIATKDIPIVFIRRKALERLGLDLKEPKIASLVGETELEQVHGTGHNVVGYLPGKSDTVIVIGAHYDHLGWGGPGSRYQGIERKIHYGADDNGSGTSGLLELAHYFGSIRDQNRHSFLFIAFSGEEKGILGSTYYMKHPTVDSTKIRMMLNMDMIGRLKDQESGLAIFGTGTAAEFKTFFDSLKADSLKPDRIKMTFREPGTGPSDHTAFYNAQIPVLHFFTGAHEDYHTPNDVISKIDFAGTARVATLVGQVASYFDRYDHALTFQRTKDSGEGMRHAAYTVTMGVMPDYTAEVKGLRVGGVTPDRPAERAGIKKGDVVIKMGNYPVEDIGTYMAALSKFRKGDSTNVVVTRNTDTLTVPVVFK